MKGCEAIQVDLFAYLKRVTPIDKDGRLRRQNNGKTGRACKTCEPGKPGGGTGNVFTLIFINHWHEKAVQFLTCKFRPERIKAAGWHQG